MQTLVIFVVSALAAFISVICLVVVFTCKNASTFPSADIKEICVEYDKMSQYLPESVINQLTKRKEGPVQRYCAETMQQLSRFLEMAMQTSEKPKRPLGAVISPDSKMLNLSSVACHRQLVSPPQYPADNSRVMLNLNVTSDDSEHRHNVQVLSSGFSVLYSGLYHVYSSVDFRPNTNKPCKNLMVKTWENSIVRVSSRNRQNSGTLARALHTCCDDCQEDKETSYTAGIFSLLAGDQLRVEVSAAGLVNFQPQTSFFGMIMLGSVEN